MKLITVRLNDELHRAVKVRAAQEGTTIQTLAAEWFRGYVNGGLSAGEQPGNTSGGRSKEAASIPGNELTEHAPPAPAEKPCSRTARHHINHPGKPCPECGWPYPRDER